MGGSADGAISDRVVVAVLRLFVRAARPVLAGLREADPFGLRGRVRGGGVPGAGGTGAPDADERALADRVLDALASVRVPGTAAWASMDVAARSRWWVRRVGRFTPLVAAVPGLGGAITSRLPVTAALGAAAQGLVLCALAGEHGVTDDDEVVALLGVVLFARRLDLSGPAVPAGGVGGSEALRQAEEAAERAGDVVGAGGGGAAGVGSSLRAGASLRTVAGAVWTLGRALLAVEDELDRRPHGNVVHETLGLVPVVGAVGKYLGEWSGLKRAARDGERWLATGELPDRRPLWRRVLGGGGA